MNTIDITFSDDTFKKNKAKEIADERLSAINRTTEKLSQI